MGHIEDERRLHFIDGLRAIAVLAVVAYHMSSTWLPGGFAGVDVFLVISGFVVSRSLTKHGYHKGWCLTFFARRFKRLFPALAVCLIVTTLACTLWVPDAWLSDRNPKTARMAFFGLSNWLLASRGDDYFSPAIDFNPYAHTWSLGLEEQFYLAFPLLAFGWLRRGAWSRLSSAALLVCSVASIAYAVTAEPEDFRFAFHLLPARAWEFLAGVLLSRLSPSPVRDEKPSAAIDLLPVIGLATIAIAFVTAKASSFPMPGAAPTVVGTSLVLYVLSVRCKSPMARMLSWRPLVLGGRMSYSMYLWHWPVFSLFRWTFGLDVFANQLVAMLLAGALAAGSWWTIERGALRVTREWPDLRTAIAGLACMGLGAVLVGAVHRQNRHWSRSVVMQDAGDWYPSVRARGIVSCGRLEATNHPVGVGWMKEIKSIGCHEKPQAPRLFAIGDSHALALGPMFALYAQRSGAEVYLYNNGGCPAVGLSFGIEASEHCRTSFKFVLDHVMPRLTGGDVVVLPSLRMARRVDQWGARTFAGELIPSGVEDARDLLRSIRASGAKVVLFAPNLILDTPLFRCADAWTERQAVCAGSRSVDRSQFEERRGPMLMALLSLANDDDGIIVFDPVPTLCGESTVCQGYRDGRPLFFDADHLSGFGATLLEPAFATAIRALF